MDCSARSLLFAMCDAEHNQYLQSSNSFSILALLDISVVKFENVMFESNSESSAIKVIDFGLSKHFAHDDIQNRFMNERVGTIYTMAPQVLQGIYSSQADMWAIGVLAFMLLGNKKPFYDRNRSKMIDLIMRADYTFDSKIWDGVAPSAKDFVNQLLVVDPSVRMDAPTALQHEWIVNRDELDNERPSQDILDSIDHNLIKYKNTSALKKIALNVIAHRSTADEIEQLRKAFEYFDAKRDGVITFGEFREALAGMNNYSDESLRELFSSIVSFNFYVSEQFALCSYSCTISFHLFPSSNERILTKPAKSCTRR
jgi:calcium-dependent protein kinase